MRILVLAPYPPYPPYGGGTMRIYQLIRGLAANHTVTCLTFAATPAEEAALEPLRALCRVLTVRGPAPRSVLRRAWTTLASPLPDMALRNASPSYAQALRRLLAAEPFDLVQAESIEMAGYLPLARTAGVRRLVLDQFNAEYLLQRRAALTALGALAAGGLRGAPRSLAGGLYSLVQWQKLWRYERQMMRRCDAVLAVSADDQRTLGRLAPQARIGVVPNGVDTAHFSRAALPAGATAFLPPESLVFSGTLDFRPNIDAAIWFAERVLPLICAQRPAARLLLVGRRPPEALRRLARRAPVTVIGEVPDARPYLAGAAVYLVPMRIGGGVRLKLLEALALEAPVVSTTMGAEGIAGLRAGQHCLLADTPETFAAGVLQLLATPALGQQLGAAGRALARSGYDWSVITPMLEAIYAQQEQP